MIGFAIGIACLFGLTRLLRRGHCGYGYGYGGYGRGCHGYRGCGDDFGPGDDGPPWRRSRGGRGPRSFFRDVLDDIDARPNQRSAIQKAIDGVIDAGGKLREQIAASRREVAQAFAGDSFDENVMADLLTRHDDAIDGVRRAVVHGLCDIHGALDPEQREQLARWLSRGPGWGAPWAHHRA